MAAGAKSKAKSKATEGGPLLPSQQSSSDDSVAAALVQKFQSGMEKKKRDKEAKYLQEYQQNMQEAVACDAEEFADHCAQIDKVLDDFVLAYAKAEDEIRLIWTKIAAAYAPFNAKVQELLEAETTQDQEREDQHVLGLAYHRKSQESYAEIISSLVEMDSD